MSDNPYETPKADLGTGIAELNENGFYGYAGFWKRFAAAIIDAIVTSVFGLIIGMIFVMLIYAIGTEYMAILQTSSNIVSIVVVWLYFATMESSKEQATLGKMALGIKVTDLNGSRVSFARATSRHFGKILSGLTFLIGFIMIGVTEKKQGLHDILAGCLVVNRNPV